MNEKPSGETKEVFEMTHQYNHEDLKTKIKKELDKMTDGVVAMSGEYADHRRLKEVFSDLPKKVNSANIDFDSQYTRYGFVRRGKRRTRGAYQAVETAAAIRVKLEDMYTNFLEASHWQEYGLTICTLQRSYVLIVGFVGYGLEYPIGSPEHLYDMLKKIDELANEYFLEELKKEKAIKLVLKTYEVKFKKAAEKYCGKISGRLLNAGDGKECINFTFDYDGIKKIQFRVDVTTDSSELEKMVAMGIDTIETFAKNEMRRSEIVEILTDYGKYFCGKYPSCSFEIYTSQYDRTELLFVNNNSKQHFGFKVAHTKSNEVIHYVLPQFELKAAEYAAK